MKQVARYIVIAIIVLGLGLGGSRYWYTSTYYPSTDDAYVSAHTVQVAPRISGSVLAVSVHDHENVLKGQRLYSIDPTTYRLQVRTARAELGLARQDVAQLAAAVMAAGAKVQQAQVLSANARGKAERQVRLNKRGFANQQTMENAEDAARAAAAALQVSAARLAQARLMMGKPGLQNHQIQAAQARLKLTETKLSYTQVIAACDAQISRFRLRPGDYVVRGQPNFVLVCKHSWWVSANFKETDLGRIQPGENATITVDMYGGHTFRGRVLSINPASGSAFSLLPPENATGSWVKVTQRIPVRVTILDVEDQFPLRVGASAVVSIDTLHGSDPQPSSPAKIH